MTRLISCEDTGQAFRTTMTLSVIFPAADSLSAVLKVLDSPKIAMTSTFGGCQWLIYLRMLRRVAPPPPPHLMSHIPRARHPDQNPRRSARATCHPQTIPQSHKK